MHSYLPNQTHDGTEQPVQGTSLKDGDCNDRCLALWTDRLDW